MEWREVGPEDLVECLNIEPSMWGDEIVGREQAFEAWNWMARSLACNSAVIETDGPTKKKIAFGFGGFVTPEFADRELANPRPGINNRIVASLETDKPAIRSEASLCKTHEPMDVVIMGGHISYDQLTPEEAIEVETLMPTTFAVSHMGYRLNRVLAETLTERSRQILESSGVWRKVADYPEYKRALMILTKKDAISVSGSIAGLLFDYHQPVLGLQQAEKQLLAEALKGGTDNELAAGLNLSVATVKKRWASLFERIAAARPDLVPGADARESTEIRGPQKRHRILTYVRAHPEEIRPYRWRGNMV